MNARLRQQNQKLALSIDQFPESVEARHSKTQIGNIQSMSEAERSRYQKRSGKNKEVDQGSGRTQETMRAMSRYTDAYHVAQATTTIGGVVKATGIILAVIVLLVGLAMASESNETMIGVAAVPVSIALGASLYVLGLLVSAQGQVLKAILDNTVTGSPFLTHDEMRKVMSIQ